MKKLLKSLPSDWLYQLITLSMITTSAFYLFQFTDEYEFVRDFWKMNEKFYIYTFLGMQFIVKAFFYWGLFLLLKKLLFGRIKSKVLGVLNEPKTREDMKIIVEIKQFFVQIFGIPVEMGLIDHEDLNDKIEMTEEELEETMKSMVKWSCVFIHVGFTSLLVWKLSAFYIIPLLIVVFVTTISFWYGVTIFYGNIRLIEKTRNELVCLSSIDKPNSTTDG